MVFSLELDHRDLYPIVLVGFPFQDLEARSGTKEHLGLHDVVEGQVGRHERTARMVDLEENPLVRRFGSINEFLSDVFGEARTGKDASKTMLPGTYRRSRSSFVCQAPR